VKISTNGDITPCSVVEVPRRFRNTCYLHRQARLTMNVGSASDTSAHFYQTTRRHVTDDTAVKL